MWGLFPWLAPLGSFIIVQAREGERGGKGERGHTIFLLLPPRGKVRVQKRNKTQKCNQEKRDEKGIAELQKNAVRKKEKSKGGKRGPSKQTMHFSHL